MKWFSSDKVYVPKCLLPFYIFQTNLAFFHLCCRKLFILRTDGFTVRHNKSSVYFRVMYTIQNSRNHFAFRNPKIECLLWIVLLKRKHFCCFQKLERIFNPFITRRFESLTTYKHIAYNAKNNLICLGNMSFGN